MKRSKFTEKGLSSSDLSDLLESHKSGDIQWKEGKLFGFVYYPGSQHARISEKYYRAFFHESTLNPSTFPSLKKFEKDIIRMATDLLHGDTKVAGNITSGGTESIFLALKVARDLAREKETHLNNFEAILPVTAHPAFLKACQYLSIKPIIIPVTEDKRADVIAIKEAITSRTILVACSAPCFPYGVVDPVLEIGRIAENHNLLCHVDACMGGFMLPFLEELGYPVPDFDFRVPGVTSISLDAHKYGYAPKGASIILYRNRKLRKKQFFVHTDWPGGIFATTTFMGTKSGGPVAGCWAIMNHLGREGYRKIAEEVMRTTQVIRDGIQKIEGLKIVGDPDMSVLAFTSENKDIFNIANALSENGWHLDLLQFPDCLHLTVTKLNVGREEEFLRDLREIIGDTSELHKACKTINTSVKVAGGLSRVLPPSVFRSLTRLAEKKLNKTGKSGSIPQAALYGISASFRNRKNVKRIVENLLDVMF